MLNNRCNTDEERVIIEYAVEMSRLVDYTLLINIRRRRSKRDTLDGRFAELYLNKNSLILSEDIIMMREYSR